MQIEWDPLGCSIKSIHSLIVFRSNFLQRRDNILMAFVPIGTKQMAKGVFLLWDKTKDETDSKRAIQPNRISFAFGFSKK